MHLTKFVLLGLIASVIASLLSLLLLPLIPAVSGSLVSQEVTLSVSLSSIVLSSLVVIVGGILFCLPQLLQIYQLRPAVLFHGEDDLPGHKKQWLNYFPVIIFYFVLACWQAQSIFVGSLFVIALSFTIAILILIAMILLSFLNSIRLKCGFETQMALLNLSRLRISTLTCFLALGLGGVLINLVPQIYKMMENQLNNPQESQLPSLFLFDIQQEQLPLLKTFMQTQPTKLNYVSSMIQTRLVAINGEKISTKTQLKNHQTREQQQFGRMQNRIYNITTRASLVPSEQIIEGDALSAIYDWDSKKLPLISIESSFAKQLGVTVGSTLSFDVFGVEIKSRVLNIRRVRWSSFHPNFYVKFQQGVLDDAPKTYIAAIPKLLFNEKMKVQNAIVKQFSNISIIDVDQIVDRILNISKQMNNAIILMAWVALIAGFCVLFFISRFQAQQRQYDFTLLKVLGCQFSQIRQIALIEFVILGGMAVLTGGLLSVIVSILLSYFIFDNHLVFYWQPLLLNTMLLILVSVLTGISATHHYLKIKPVSILR